MKFYDGVRDALGVMTAPGWRRTHVLHVLGYDGVCCTALRKSEDALYRSSAFLGSDDMIYEVGAIHDLNLLPAGVEAVADGYVDRHGDFVPRSDLTKSDALRAWLQQHQQPRHDTEAIRDAVGHMLGSTTEALKAAARLLAPEGAEPQEVKEVDDPLDAALLTWGLEPTAARRAQLQELAGLQKSEIRPALVPMHVEPVTPAAQAAAEAIRRAEAQRLIYEAQLGGKHSSGTAVAMDPRSDALWMLKPGSGPLSPAAGIGDTDTSQARREVAAATVGRLLCPANFPDTQLITMGGHEVAAIKVVPRDAVPAQRLTIDPRRVFGSHVTDGTLFQWAAIDWVLGNVDRHGGNILVAPGRAVYLIDHGSTLAGPGFSPATDSKSFVPYYLRAWAPHWKSLSVAQRRQAVPDTSPGVHQAFRHWIRDVFTADRLAAVHELAPEAWPYVMARLRDLQAATDPLGHLLDLWTGVAQPAGVAQAVQQPNPGQLSKANYNEADLRDGLDFVAENYDQPRSDVKFKGISQIAPADFIDDAAHLGRNPAGWLREFPREQWATELRSEYSRDFQHILRQYDAGQLQSGIRIDGRFGDGRGRAMFHHAIGAPAMSVADFESLSGQSMEQR